MIFNFKSVDDGYSIYRDGILLGAYSRHEVELLPIQGGLEIIIDKANEHIALAIPGDTIQINGNTQSGTRSEIIEKLIAEVFSSTGGN